MGFMGLSSWVESDCAADFRYTLQKQFEKFSTHPVALKQAIREVVDSELADMANEYNTPGYLNLALCIEAEGDTGNPEYEDPGLPVFSTFLTVAQLQRASRLFVKEGPDWCDEHRSRLNKLHQVITKLLKLKRGSNR